MRPSRSTSTRLQKPMLGKHVYVRRQFRHAVFGELMQYEAMRLPFRSTRVLHEPKTRN